MAAKPPADTSLRSQVYDSLRDALTAGRFTPGQKLSFRFIAGTLGVSMTPVPANASGSWTERLTQVA